MFPFQVQNSIIFKVHSELYIYHCIQFYNIFLTINEILYSLTVSPYPPFSHPRETTNIFSVYMDLDSNLDISCKQHYVTCCLMWLISFTEDMFSGINHAIICISFSLLFCWKSFHCMGISYFKQNIHSSVDRYLNYLHFCASFCVDIFSSVRYIPRCGTAGSINKCEVVYHCDFFFFFGPED